MTESDNIKNNISITESSSNFEDIDKMSVHELLTNINQEDSKVHIAVREAIPQLEDLINRIVKRCRYKRQTWGSGRIRGTTNIRCSRYNGHRINCRR
jgi:hypothetical protein